MNPEDARPGGVTGGEEEIGKTTHGCGWKRMERRFTHRIDSKGNTVVSNRDDTNTTEGVLLVARCGELFVNKLNCRVRPPGANRARRRGGKNHSDRSNPGKSVILKATKKIESISVGMFTGCANLRIEARLERIRPHPKRNASMREGFMPDALLFGLVGKCLKTDCCRLFFSGINLRTMCWICTVETWIERFSALIPFGRVCGGNCVHVPGLTFGPSVKLQVRAMDVFNKQKTEIHCTGAEDSTKHIRIIHA